MPVHTPPARTCPARRRQPRPLRAPDDVRALQQRRTLLVPPLAEDRQDALGRALSPLRPIVFRAASERCLTTRRHRACEVTPSGTRVRCQEELTRRLCVYDRRPPVARAFSMLRHPLRRTIKQAPEPRSANIAGSVAAAGARRRRPLCSKMCSKKWSSVSLAAWRWQQNQAQSMTCLRFTRIMMVPRGGPIFIRPRKCTGRSRRGSCGRSPGRGDARYGEVGRPYAAVAAGFPGDRSRCCGPGGGARRAGRSATDRPRGDRLRGPASPGNGAARAIRSSMLGPRTLHG
jgi:hypothetical protein